MQDRFYFRCWHKTRKKMYEVLHLHVGTYDNGGDWATAKGFNVITQQDIHIQIQPKDCILMQCTGLKDKNDKLVYFDDIAKDKNGIIDVIRWYQGIILFNGQAVTGVTEGDRLGYYMHEIEVIGNIYENPELLEKAGEE